MKRILFFFFTILTLAINPFMKVEATAAFNKQSFEQQELVPVERTKPKKKIKRIKKNKDRYDSACSSEVIIGVLTWTILIIGAFMFFTCYVAIFSYIVWLVALILLGTAILLAIVSTICFYFIYESPDQAMALVVPIFITEGLNIILGLISLIGGIVISVPAVWIVGIALLVCALLLLALLFCISYKEPHCRSRKKK